MPELEEQRKGRNKATLINKSYIESGDFRKKFDRITQSDKLNRLLYQLAKKMLYHRAGTLFEDMYWIDLNSGEIVAQETDRDFEEEIQYSEATQKAIASHRDLLTIHSHPGSFPPSITDFVSNFEHGYSLGVVVCHNGAIYSYVANEKISEVYYNLKVADFLKMGYTEAEAQVEALKKLKEQYDIGFKEVTNDGM